MPMNMRKPNLGSQLKTSFNMSIPKAGAQKPAKHGDVGSNNNMFSMNSGGRAPKSAGPKKSKRMY